MLSPHTLLQSYYQLTLCECSGRCKRVYYCCACFCQYLCACLDTVHLLPWWSDRCLHCEKIFHHLLDQTHARLWLARSFLTGKSTHAYFLQFDTVQLSITTKRTQCCTHTCSVLLCLIIVMAHKDVVLQRGILDPWVLGCIANTASHRHTATFLVHLSQHSCQQAGLACFPQHNVSAVCQRLHRGSAATSCCPLT